MVYVSDRATGAVIPRSLYQTFPTDNLPADLASGVNQLRDANRDWQYRLYDDKAIRAFVSEHYGHEVLRLIDRIAPEYGVAKADLFRYLLIYEKGGVYLDIKSRFLVPMSSVIVGDESYILSQWQNGPGQRHEGWGLHADLADVPGGEFQQWHVIAAAGHPFLRAVIERVLHAVAHYRPYQDETGWLGVLRLTGPICYTRAIAPLIGRYPCRRIADESEIGLDYSIMGGSRHKTLFERHYTTSTLPVVRRRGLTGLMDRTYMALRARKRRWMAAERS